MRLTSATNHIHGTSRRTCEARTVGVLGLETCSMLIVYEAVFTPRFIAVIVASLTKLGTKFPEFSPRVIVCLLKMRQHYESDTAEGIEFVRDRLTDSLQLLRRAPDVNATTNTRELAKGHVLCCLKADVLCRRRI